MDLLVPGGVGARWQPIKDSASAYPFWSLVLLVISCGLARSQPIQYYASGSPNKSADTLYSPVGGSQGPQDAHGLPLLVPGAGGEGARSQPIRYSVSGSPNESADTPYDTVGSPQVPQEAHGKHLFVPGAGAVGHINMTDG